MGKKQLNLSGAKEILNQAPSSEERTLNLSGAQEILKKKDQTEPSLNQSQQLKSTSSLASGQSGQLNQQPSIDTSGEQKPFVPGLPSLSQLINAPSQPQSGDVQTEKQAALQKVGFEAPHVVKEKERKANVAADQVLYGKTGSLKPTEQNDWLFSTDESKRESVKNDLSAQGLSDEQIQSFFTKSEEDALRRIGYKQALKFEDSIYKEIKDLKPDLGEKEFKDAFHKKIIDSHFKYGLDQLDPVDKETLPVVQEYWDIRRKLRDNRIQGNERQIAIDRAIELNNQIKGIREGQGDLFNPTTGEKDPEYTQKVLSNEKSLTRNTFDELLNMREKRMYQLMALEEQFGIEKQRFYSDDMVGSRPSSPSYERAENAYLEAKAKFDAVNRALLLNEDPSSVEKGVLGGFVSSLGEGTAEGFGFNVNSDQDFKENYVKAISQAGGTVTKEEVDAAQQNLAQKVGYGIGSSIPIMAEIAISELATAGTIGTLKSIATVKKAFDTLEEAAAANKVIKYGGDMLKGAIVYGAIPGEDVTAAMGAGEHLAQSVFDEMNIAPMLAKTKWGKAINLAVRTTGGAVAETVAEYSGEYLDQLEKTGFDYKKSFERTFGRTFEEAKDKLLVTALTSALFSGASNVSNVIAAKKYYEETGDSQRVSEVEEIAKQAGIDLKKAEEAVKKQGDNISEPEIKYNQTQENLINKQMEDNPSLSREQVVKELVRSEQIPDLTTKEPLKKEAGKEIDKEQETTDNKQLKTESYAEESRKQTEISSQETKPVERTDGGVRLRDTEQVGQKEVEQEKVIAPILEEKAAEVTSATKEAVDKTEAAYAIPLKSKEQINRENKHNSVLDIKEEYNSLSESKRKSYDLSSAIKIASELGYKIEKKKNGKIEVLKESGKKAIRIGEKEVISTQTNEEILTAKEQLKSGVTNWDGNPLSPRVDLGISWNDIRKGEADIKKGSTNTVPAKKLIRALNESVSEGGYRYISGAGKLIVSHWVPSEANVKLEFEELTKEEQNKILEKENEYSLEYDEYFDNLTEDQKIEELNDIEDGKSARKTTEETSSKQEGSSFKNVSNKKDAGATTEEKPKSASGKLREAAGRVRQADISNITKKLEEKLGIKLSAGIEGVTKNSSYDTMIRGVQEIIAKGIETTADVTEVIEEAIKYIKESDWHKSLNTEHKKVAEDLIIENVKEQVESIKKEMGFEPEVKTKQTNEKPSKLSDDKETKESRGFKRTRLNELDEDIKKKLENIANYEVQDNKEFNDKIVEFINDVTVDIAIDFAMEMPENISDGSAQRKQVILMNAGAMKRIEASSELKRTKKEGDLSGQAKAEEDLALAYNAINVASKIGTKAGQLISVLAEIHKKFPSTFMIQGMDAIKNNGKEVLQDKTVFANKDGEKISIEDAIEEERIRIEKELRKEIEEEFKSKVDELNNKIQELEKEKPERKKSTEERKIQIKKERKKILEEFRKTLRSEQAQVTLIPFTAKQIELITKYISLTAQLGGLTAKQIVTDVYNEFKKINPTTNRDVVEEIAKSVKEFNSIVNEESLEKKKSDQGKISKLKEKGELSEKEIKELITAKRLKDIVVKHLFDRKGYSKSLADTIVNETGMELDSAKDLSESLAKLIDPIIKNKVESRLQQILKSKDTSLSNEDVLKKKVNKKTVDRVVEAIKLGALSNNEMFQSAFQDKFGFRTIDTRTSAKMKDIIQQVEELEQSTRKQVEIETQGGKEIIEIDITQREKILGLQREFNNILQSLTPLNTAIVLSELQSAIYISILSDTTSTSWKALVGSLGSSIIGLTTKPSYKGVKAVFLGLGAAKSRAATALRSGLVEPGEIRTMDEFGGERQSRVETSILDGARNALKNKEYGKAAGKYIGNIVKNVRILSALDAFLVSAMGSYYEAADGLSPKQGSIASKMSSEQQNKVYKDIANKEYEYIKADVINEVENEIIKGRLKSANKESEINRRLKREVRSIGDPESAYKNKRIQELKENQAKESFAKGWAMAKYFSLIGKSDGFLGAGLDVIQKRTAIKPTDSPMEAASKFAFGMFFKFLNMTGNFYQATVNSIPVIGIANSYLGWGYDPIKKEYVRELTGKYKANPRLAHTRAITNGIITGAVLAALADQLKWDEEEDEYVLDPERNIDFRGFGFSNWLKNKKIAEDYEEFSFSFSKDKNGNFDNYHSFSKYIPQLNSIVATVSAVTDNFKKIDNEQSIRETELKPIKENALRVLESNIKGFLEGSFNSLGRATKPFLYGDETFIENLFEVVGNSILDNAGAITRPNSINSIINYYRNLMDLPAKERKTIEEKALNALYMDAFLNKDKTDPFGNPIPQSNDVERFFTEAQKQSALYPKTAGLMYKHGKGVEINKWRATEMKEFNKFSIYGEAYYSTEDIKDEVVKIQETEFNRLIIENYNELKNLDYNDLNDKMKAYQDQSKDFAKEKVVEKYLDVTNKKSKIKKIED